MKNGYFYSPSYGRLTFSQMRLKILDFIKKDASSYYRIVIGSDSAFKNRQKLDIITAIVVHRQGKGGIYFWKRLEKTVKEKMIKLPLVNLRGRIYEEALTSLATANEFLQQIKNNGLFKFEVEIHVDIGQRGSTREMLAEIVGMIRGSGFKVKTKPESYGASKVADRYT